MVKGLTYLVQLLILISVVLKLVLVAEHLLSQLFDLDLVVGRIEQLPLCLLELHPKQLYLIRQAFDFNGLEHQDETDVFSEVAFLIVRQVLDAGPEWGVGYLRRSSP